MCNSLSELIEREKYWIAFNFANNIIHPNSGGMNMNDGKGHTVRKNHTEEANEKMRVRMSGEKNSMYNKKHSKETKEKIRKTKIGNVKNSNLTNNRNKKSFSKIKEYPDLFSDYIIIKLVLKKF